MEQFDNYRLCGGTFFAVLFHYCRRMNRDSMDRRSSGQEGRKDGYSQSELYQMLIQVVDPGQLFYAPSTLASHASRYMDCSRASLSSMPVPDSDQVLHFDEAVRERYREPLENMAKLVSVFENTGEAHLQFLLNDLLTLVRLDKWIGEDTLFYVRSDGQPVPKRLLDEQVSVSLPAFLLGLWHYCVMRVQDNRVGADTVAYCMKGGSYHRLSRDPLFVQVSVALPEAVSDQTQEEQALPVGEVSAESIRYAPYLEAIAERLRYVKMVLRDESYEFQKCYVPTDLTDDPAVLRDDPDIPILLTAHGANLPDLSEISSRIMVQGSGGMGKSMLLRHLWYDGAVVCPATGRVPVFVWLKDYIFSDIPLESFFFSQLQTYFPDADREIFDQDLKAGKFVLLLDGLDEISSYFRSRFLQNLNRFSALFRKTQIIMTSRPFSAHTEINGFKVLYVSPLAKSQVLEMVERLQFAVNNPGLRVRFLQELDEKLYETHRVFATNPLLLTFMMLTFGRFGELPVEKYQFYDEVFSVLATRHDSDKDGFVRQYCSGLSVRRLQDIFAAFCSMTYQAEEYSFSWQQLSNRFQAILDCLPDERESKIPPEALIEDYTDGVCMLYREGEQYFFVHRSFQEYFCALSLSRQMEEDLFDIGAYFDRKDPDSGDLAFSFLFDMIPDKVEHCILLPMLETMFDPEEAGEDLSEHESYWAFLSAAYAVMDYDLGEPIFTTAVGKASSYLYQFLAEKNGFKEWLNSDEFPYYREFVEQIHWRIDTRDGKEMITCWDTDRNFQSNLDYVENNDPYLEEYGLTLKFSPDELLADPEHYQELIEMIDGPDFPYKKEFYAARNLRDEMRARQKKQNRNLGAKIPIRII